MTSDVISEFVLARKLWLGLVTVGHWQMQREQTSHTQTFNLLTPLNQRDIWCIDVQLLSFTAFDVNVVHYIQVVFLWLTYRPKS